MKIQFNLRSILLAILAAGMLLAVFRGGILGVVLAFFAFATIGLAYGLLAASLTERDRKERWFLITFALLLLLLIFAAYFFAVIASYARGLMSGWH